MNIQQQPTTLGACHEIDETTGRPAIAFVGEKPWHGLGQELTAGASIETWTKEAGLDFRVERSPVFFNAQTKDADGNQGLAINSVANRDVLYRSDTLAPLGIMSKGYKIVQPADVMNFFGELAAKGGFTIETAGALRGGAKIWALAKVGEDAKILDKDIVQPYLLLATSFDGSLSTVGKFTAVRVVCRNTIGVALRNEREAKKNGVRIPHHSIFDPANVRDRLGIALDSWGAWLQSAKNMAERSLDGQAADSFLLNLLRKPKVAEEDVRESTTYRTVMSLFEGKALGSEITGGRTEWQMLNSVTEFVDHMRGNSRDARMNAAWFGAGDALKSSAYELLMA